MSPFLWEMKMTLMLEVPGRGNNLIEYHPRQRESGARRKWIIG
jgi:hypothetical protein